MAKSNSVNLDITPNADGYSIAGGTTPRTLTLTAGNVTLSAGGSNTYTLPAATGTLVSRDSTDTLTNKTLTDPVVNQFGTISGLGAAWSTYSPTITASSGSPTTVTVNKAAYKQIGKVVHLRVDFTITNRGTAAGLVQIPLPVTALDTSNSGNGVEIAALGAAAAVWTSSTTVMALTIATAATGWVTGYRWLAGMTYEV